MFIAGMFAGCGDCGVKLVNAPLRTFPSTLGLAQYREERKTQLPAYMLKDAIDTLTRSLMKTSQSNELTRNKTKYLRSSLKSKLGTNLDTSLPEGKKACGLILTVFKYNLGRDVVGYCHIQIVVTVCSFWMCLCCNVMNGVKDAYSGT